MTTEYDAESTSLRVSKMQLGVSWRGFFMPKPMNGNAKWLRLTLGGHHKNALFVPSSKDNSKTGRRGKGLSRK